MSSPWTITRLVRWRVRDWASCFLACRFPLDDEPNRYFTSTPPPMPLRTMVLDRKSITSRGKECSKKGERRKKCSSPYTADVAAVAALENKTTDDSIWPQFEDEDYIVFCFKKDGAFDVIKDGNSEASNRIDLVSSGSRPVSRKLNYGGDDKVVKRSSNEEKLNGCTRDFYPQNDEDHTFPSQKDEEAVENIYMDKESAMVENRITNHSEVISDCRIVAACTESSDSNHSDVSNGSFAFPVLGLEWSGSPVQMPKSEGLQLRKHKARCVEFQCCKFRKRE